MTVSEIAYHLKVSAVQMAKKLDVMIGGKGWDEVIESNNRNEMLAKTMQKSKESGHRK